MPKKKIKQVPEVYPEKDRDQVEKKHITEAYDQAGKDIEHDPDLNLKPHQETDLDEGELARLEGGD